MTKTNGRKARQNRRDRHYVVNRADEILTPLNPRTDGQRDYMSSIEKNELTICNGPAGCGKTFLSFGMALRYYLTDNDIDKIVIVRSTMPAGDEPGIGYLPGNMYEKMSPFLAPILKDSASLLIKRLARDHEVQRLLAGSNATSPADQLALIVLSRFDIEIVPLQFMRGRTFANSFVILDEAQNCSLSEFKLFLTRIGECSRVVAQGDADQSDRPDGALCEVMDRLHGLEGVGIVDMQPEDIVRSDLVSRVLTRL